MTLEMDPTSGTSCSQPALPTAPAHASSCEQAAAMLPDRLDSFGLPPPAAEERFLARRHPRPT